jgi:zinc/manganese transport system ATP-binding protein
MIGQRMNDTNPVRAGDARTEHRLTDGADGVEALLSLDRVSVTLGGREVLREVSFTVRPGQFTGLIGSNGAGKTTLLRVILGLQRPSGGAVRLAGQRIGYVPQKVLLEPDVPLRARDVVALGLDGGRLGIGLPSRRKRALVQDMLAAVDADRFADARVGELSGGEQQRVLIAHALIGRPRLLLLDEPLANLDLSSSSEVVALLARIAREQRIAVLLSAHEMNPLLPVTDRIVYLAGGRAASGPTDEVITSEVLSRLYGHHVDVLHVHGRILVVAGNGTGPVTVDEADPEHRAEVTSSVDDGGRDARSAP